MIRPCLQDEAFLADLAAASSDPTAWHLWWLGQSGFLLQWQGRRVLFDPYLSDSLTQKYARTDKPHVRITARVIDPARLTGIDVITSSHSHTDHLDAETLGPLLRQNPSAALIVPEANRALAAERLQLPQGRLTGLDAGASAALGDFTIRAVPAAHETLELDAAGHHKYLGYVVQFGSWTVYHSGDTIRYEGMAETLRQWSIDVALLPINGRGAERRVAGNLWGDEAAQLARDVGARLVIPCHYEMFEFNTGSPASFVAACQALGQPYHLLRAGQRRTCTPSPATLPTSGTERLATG